MAIRVCVAGATGWAGSAVTQAILNSREFQLVGVIARRQAGLDIGEALGKPKAGVDIAPALEEALSTAATPPDVLIDFTKPDSVKSRVLAALSKGIRVVVGTSGLTAEDYGEIEVEAKRRQLGVIAAGNFSITAALAKHFAQIAARYVPSWEIIDIFSAAGLKKPDISILSDEFLAEVRGMPQRNLAVELLEKLLQGKIKGRSKRNLVQARSFAEMLARAVRKYRNRAIETAQFIEELIQLAKDMREANQRGEALNLTEGEVAFYDALETNDSAVKVLGGTRS